MKRIFALVGVVLMALLLAPHAVSPRLITFEGAAPLLTIDELIEASDDVVLATADGRAEVHWNSFDGSKWEDPADLRAAFIVHDESLRVLRSRSGATPADIQVRQVGGTRDGTTFSTADTARFEADESLLLFLQRSKTRTREGAETAWTVVGPGIGTFRTRGDATWINGAGQLISDAEVQRLLAGPAKR